MINSNTRSNFYINNNNTISSNKTNSNHYNYHHNNNSINNNNNNINTANNTGLNNLTANSVEPPVSSTNELHYCPITQFISDLLKLLTCQNEKFGCQVQRHIQDLLGNELSTLCYPILFEQIKLIIDKFFENSGQVCVNEQNTLFIENVIFIMKSVLENKSENNGENPFSTVSVEILMINIVRYVRHLDSSVQIIQIKTKVCQLVCAVMKRREDLLFRQEMKFRNKLVEYLTGKDFKA